jgi:hypothetical protein
VDALPSIEFDGKTVKPTAGKYKCPFRCHTAGFPAPSWKTEKGFRKHMDSCAGSPSATKRRADAAAAVAAEGRARGEAAAAALGLSLGDEIFYTTYTVTGPTHQQRFDRMVRVRYEELRSYYGAQARVESFGWAGALIINGRIAARDLCESLSDAKAKATAAQQRYQEHLDHSAACR